MDEGLLGKRPEKMDGECGTSSAKDYVARWISIASGIMLLTVVCILASFSAVSRRGGGPTHKPLHAHGKTGVSHCQAYLDWEVEGMFSAILTADPGDFSGVSEAHFILANLKGRQDRPRGSSVCGGISTGWLMGQPVVVVTTGIGPSAASLCTLELLTKCGSSIQDAVYFGTSGWSPQPGGMLNPPNCSQANWRQTVARTGDVCISPFCVNWTCKKSSYAAQASGAGNQCSRPTEEAGPSDTPLFGECMFYKDNIHHNLDLADGILNIARSETGLRNFPLRTDAVFAHELDYWGVMAEGVGKKGLLPKLERYAPPNIWDYNQCMEVDGQWFYNGSPWELKARDYASATLNAALDELQRIASLDVDSDITGVLSAYRSTSDGPRLRPTTAADVIAVSAMEGVGVSEAFLRYHGLSTTSRPIPYTHIRTLSNWMVQPVQQSSPGVWKPFHDVSEDFINGYAFAIATGSATLLTFFQSRCLDAASLVSKCDFDIITEDFLKQLSTRTSS